MDEVDVLSKATESITRRNWILQGRPSTSLDHDSSSGGPVFTVERNRTTPETETVSYSAPPPVARSRFQSLAKRQGVNTMEKVDNVNGLNEKMSIHRRWDESSGQQIGSFVESDNVSGSGSSRIVSFSRQATLLVEESFSFIDNELNKNPVDASCREQQSIVSCSRGEHGMTGRPTVDGKMDRMDEMPPESVEFSKVSVESDSTSTPAVRVEMSEECATSINASSQESEPGSAVMPDPSAMSSTTNELILRCASEDGEICAVYERRPTSLVIPNSTDSGNGEVDKEKLEENETCCSQSHHQNKRSLSQRLAVSFDDRIVVVDGTSASTSSPDGPDENESWFVLGRLKHFLRRFKKNNAKIKSTEGVDSVDVVRPNGDVDIEVGSLARVAENLPFGQCDGICHFTKSYFDSTAGPGSLKINPLYEGDEKTVPVSYRKFDHYYCDLGLAATDLRPDGKASAEGNAPTGCDPPPSNSYRLSRVHSKADERLRRMKDENNDHQFNQFDFEQLRTKKFGLAVTFMILILILAGIGIGLTIYLD